MSSPTTLTTPAVRPLVAKDVKVGDRVAIKMPDNSSRAARVTSVHVEQPDEVTFGLDITGVADAYRGTFHPDTPMVALPAHYGVCHQCGQLAPCPDELTERVLEMWWLLNPSSVTTS